MAESLLAKHGISYTTRGHSSGRAGHDMAARNAAQLLPRLELDDGYIVPGISRVSGWILSHPASGTNADKAWRERGNAAPGDDRLPPRPPAASPGQPSAGAT